MKLFEELKGLPRKDTTKRSNSKADRSEAPPLSENLQIYVKNTFPAQELMPSE